MRRVTTSVLLGSLLAAIAGSAAMAEAPSPSPETVGRQVDIPEAGVALEVPEDWIVEVETVEFGRTESEAGPLISISVLTTQPPEPWLPTHCALSRFEFPPSLEVPVLVWLDLMGDAMARGEAPREGGIDFVTREVGLPVGEALKYAYRVPHETGISVDFVEYYVAAGDRVFGLKCSSLPALVPADDWLSIAETIEFLPAEE